MGGLWGGGVWGMDPPQMGVEVPIGVEERGRDPYYGDIMGYSRPKWEWRSLWGGLWGGGVWGMDPPKWGWRSLWGGYGVGGGVWGPSMGQNWGLFVGRGASKGCSPISYKGFPYALYGATPPPQIEPLPGLLWDVSPPSPSPWDYYGMSPPHRSRG